ncbi:MAG: thermonuclease family protein [Thermomicrobiales bacterium]
MDRISDSRSRVAGQSRHRPASLFARLAVIFMVLVAAVPLQGALTIDQNLDIVPITEVGESDVFGDATLIDNGDDTTTVDILVSGVTGDHPAVIRTGTCDNPGTVAFNLEPVAADGTSVTDIDVRLGDFLSDGPWAVIIRRSAAAGAPNIACGTIGQSSTTSPPGPTSTAAPQPTATVQDASPPTPSPSPTPDPSLPTCQDFDAWVWAQSVFVQSPEEYEPTLDADGNGIACEQLPIQGFAPALWEETMPEDLVPVRVTGFYNGDTMQILADGQFDVVRLNGVAAPTSEQCGYVSSASFLAFVLNIAPNLTLFVDYQTARRDAQNQLVANVWYDYAGDPYLINEVVARNGWAEPAPAEDFDEFAEQIDEAAQFAEDHVLGAYLECGGFQLPPGSTPSPEQLELARDRQPGQGQFPQ